MTVNKKWSITTLFTAALLGLSLLGQADARNSCQASFSSPTGYPWQRVNIDGSLNIRVTNVSDGDAPASPQTLTVYRNGQKILTIPANAYYGVMARGTGNVTIKARNLTQCGFVIGETVVASFNW